MRIAWSQLHHLPVITESGQKVGVIEGVTVDVDSQTIAQYEIKPAGKLSALFAKVLLVSPEQVVSVTSEKMIVKDAVSGQPATNTQEKTRLASAPVTNTTIPSIEMD